MRTRRTRTASSTIIALTAVTLIAAAPAAGIDLVSSNCTLIDAMEDNYVFRLEPNAVQDYMSHLTIKGENDSYIRKGWIKWDLSVVTLPAKNAAIALTFRSTKTTGTHTFALHGLIDDSLDDWSEESITWNNAPGNDTNGNGVLEVQTTLLGTFDVPNDAEDGDRFIIQGVELDDFLNESGNAIASIIVRRTTIHARGHNFYSSETGIIGETTPQLIFPQPGDLNVDGVVNVFDLLKLLDSWGECSNCPADLDGNGTVNVFDLLDLLGAWGPCP